MAPSEEEVFRTISPILQEYSKRHRNITRLLNRHCEKVQHLFPELGLDADQLSSHRKLLLGSCFTHGYSIESAAFFNPSLVEDPDQSELEAGEKRVIISFRAVGEGHISSIVFRRALLDREANIHLLPASSYIDEAEMVSCAVYARGLPLKLPVICGDTYFLVKSNGPRHPDGPWGIARCRGQNEMNNRCYLPAFKGVTIGNLTASDVLPWHSNDRSGCPVPHRYSLGRVAYAG